MLTYLILSLSRNSFNFFTGIKCSFVLVLISAYALVWDNQGGSPQHLRKGVPLGILGSGLLARAAAAAGSRAPGAGRRCTPRQPSPKSTIRSTPPVLATCCK